MKKRTFYMTGDVQQYSDAGKLKQIRLADFFVTAGKLLSRHGVKPADVIYAVRFDGKNCFLGAYGYGRYDRPYNQRTLPVKEPGKPRQLGRMIARAVAATSNVAYAEATGQLRY